MNGSSQKTSAMAEYLIPVYELKNLLPNTWYIISARPHTLEGEGKESKEVPAKTGAGGG